ncbi:hypothetical protein KDI_25630 [Dictyobacter arantiisoli]|uniref:Uncharacterized protein n=1 Tax=Dictyobacter arantiisoli TaxID=2014874 RepID=A0A5A5TD90_9CHLR|nr:hypothetical protein KDI_25630 [Dictyobacter arantiisoli]
MKKNYIVDRRIHDNIDEPSRSAKLMAELHEDAPFDLSKNRQEKIKSPERDNTTSAGGAKSQEA